MTKDPVQQHREDTYRLLMRREALDKLKADTYAAIARYDKLQDHAPHNEAEKDCIRCRLLRALHGNLK